LTQGRRLVLPALLVAEIAAEYAEELRTETPPPRVSILLTEGPDDQLAQVVSHPPMCS
jgi:hypothetical protein